MRLNTITVFTDGYFTRPGGGNTIFAPTPPEVHQNRIRVTSVLIPVLIKYEVFSNSSSRGISLGLGPYVEALIDKKQFYRIDRKDYSEKAPLDNNIQAGLVIDFGASGALQKKYAVGFGGGLQYQLTNYLENSSSFSPTIFYLRVGLRMK